MNDNQGSASVHMNWSTLGVAIFSPDDYNANKTLHWSLMMSSPYKTGPTVLPSQWIWIVNDGNFTRDAFTHWLCIWCYWNQMDSNYFIYLASYCTIGWMKYGYILGTKWYIYSVKPFQICMLAADLTRTPDINKPLLLAS